MNLNYFRMYWETQKGTALVKQHMRIRCHRKVIWQGSILDFINTKRISQFSEDDEWVVVYFGHPAITDADEKIPEYNRPIEIQVI